MNASTVEMKRVTSGVMFLFDIGGDIQTTEFIRLELGGVFGDCCFTKYDIDRRMLNPMRVLIPLCIVISCCFACVARVGGMGVLSDGGARQLCCCLYSDIFNSMSTNGFVDRCTLRRPH